MSNVITLAGVPEQVNIPIRICMERGLFAKHNCAVVFTEVREGTGRMIDMLEKSEIDLALTVTGKVLLSTSFFV